jgi:methylphosphotriester-DNA--protein-cysteine methyltransferase
MIAHIDIGGNLKQKIRSGQITLGGYRKKKIYGTLRCSSGKRMKTANRVFFKDEEEAVSYGYRPCAHCMPEKYKYWKNAQFTA